MEWIVITDCDIDNLAAQQSIDRVAWVGVRIVGVDVVVGELM